jgi:hypothetical protein
MKPTNKPEGRTLVSMLDKATGQVLTGYLPTKTGETAKFYHWMTIDDLLEVKKKIREETLRSLTRKENMEAMLAPSKPKRGRPFKNKPK